MSLGKNEALGLFGDDPHLQGIPLFGNSLMISHTPPNFTPASYEVSRIKRACNTSISGRLRSASDLEERGLINKTQKGVLKELIISGDHQLQNALDAYESGDPTPLEGLMEQGLLNHSNQLDLLQDLDLGFMDLGSSEKEETIDTGGTDSEDDPGGMTLSKGNGGLQGGGEENAIGDNDDPLRGSVGVGIEDLGIVIKVEGDEEVESIRGISIGDETRISGISGITVGDGGRISGTSIGEDGLLFIKDADLRRIEDDEEFDIGGEMEFGATFEDVYVKQEGIQMEEDERGDVDRLCSSHNCAGAPGTTSLNTSVGPMLRVGSMSEHPSSQECSRGSDGGGGDEGLGGRGGGGDGGQTVGSMLAGFGSLEAGTVSAFSPQFKFSFTDDHLDLGIGLKDELQDLESLSGPFLGRSKGSASPGSAGWSSCLQLLSRGGSSIKSELTLAGASAMSGGGASNTVGTRAGTSGSAVGGTGACGTEASAGQGAITPATSGVGLHLRGEKGGRGSLAAGKSSASSGGTVSSGGRVGEAAATAAARGKPSVPGTGVIVGGGKEGVGGGDGERKLVGAYSPGARRQRIERFMQKREHRVWTKMVKYDVRKNFADTRMRVKGRFVKKEDEALLREVMALV